MARSTPQRQRQAHLLAEENLRLNGVYVWNVRDNDTAVQSYPIVSTSMFLNPVPRSNTPFSLTQNLSSSMPTTAVPAPGG